MLSVTPALSLAAGASASPLWPGERTAAGTIAVAVAAVGVAAWSEWRITKRANAERERSDKLRAEELARHETELSEERQLAGKRLSDERQAADDRLQRQIAHSESLLAAERQRAGDEEQLAEAWAVEVVGARMGPEDGVVSTPDNPSERPAVVVINSGRYTITRVEARSIRHDGTGTVAT